MNKHVISQQERKLNSLIISEHNPVFDLSVLTYLSMCRASLIEELVLWLDSIETG